LGFQHLLQTNYQLSPPMAICTPSYRIWGSPSWTPLLVKMDSCPLLLTRMTPTCLGGVDLTALEAPRRSSVTCLQPSAPATPSVSPALFGVPSNGMRDSASLQLRKLLLGRTSCNYPPISQQTVFIWIRILYSE